MRVTGFPAPFSTWERTSLYPFEYKINKENILEESCGWMVGMDIRHYELHFQLEKYFKFKYCKTVLYSILDSSGILRSSFCNYVRKMIQLQNKEHELQLKIWNETCKFGKKFSVRNDSQNLKNKPKKWSK